MSAFLGAFFNLGVELHCPRSLSSMTRNSIKGLVMQNPSNIDIIAGLEDEQGNLTTALRNAADGVFAVIIHRPCPAARKPMFVCLCVWFFYLAQRTRSLTASPP